MTDKWNFSLPGRGAAAAQIVFGKLRRESQVVAPLAVKRAIPLMITFAPRFLLAALKKRQKAKKARF